MSDRAAPRDTQFDHQGEMVQQLIDWDRLSLYTAMPGIIEQYNARTRRASVRPALRVVYADDAEVDRPILHNVQVVWPRGRFGSLHFRLQKGDPVWLMFSMAGLQEFRQTHRMATPDPEGGHAMKDAVVFAGFGAVQEIEAIEDYDTWQSDDGQRSFRMNEATVEARNEGTSQVLRPDGIDMTTPGDIVLNARHVFHGGVSIDKHHTHFYVRPQHPAGTVPTETPMEPASPSAASSSAASTAQELQSQGVDEAGVAESLAESGYTAEAASDGLDAAFPTSTDAEKAGALRNAGYSASDVGQALRPTDVSSDARNLASEGADSEAVAASLADDGYSAREAAEGVRAAYPNITDNELEEALQDAGYSDAEAQRASGADVGAAKSTASTLRSGGYEAPDVAEVLEMLFGILEDLLSMILQGSGYSAEESDPQLSMPGEVAIAILAACPGLTQNELADALIDGCPDDLSHAQVAFALTEAYPAATATEVASAVANGDPDITAAEMAIALQGAGFAAADVRTALEAQFPGVTAATIAGQLLAREYDAAQTAVILGGANYTSTEIAAALQQEEQTADDVAAALAANDDSLTSTQVASDVAAAFTSITQAEMATALVAAGFSTADVVTGIRAQFTAINAHHMAQALMTADVSASDAVTAIEASYNTSLTDMADVLHGAGYGLDEGAAALAEVYSSATAAQVADAINSGYVNVTAAEMAVALQAAGFAAADVQTAIMAEYPTATATTIAMELAAITLPEPYTTAQLATILQGAGYGATDTANAILAARPDTTHGEMATALRDAGYSENDIAAAMKAAYPSITAAELATAMVCPPDPA